MSSKSAVRNVKRVALGVSKSAVRNVKRVPLVPVNEYVLSAALNLGGGAVCLDVKVYPFDWLVVFCEVEAVVAVLAVFAALRCSCFRLAASSSPAFCMSYTRRLSASVTGHMTAVNNNTGN